MLGIGLGPGNSYGVDGNFAAQIDHHPLRMQRVVFAGKGFREVRITFPVGFRVTVGEPRPAVSVAPAEATVR